MQDSFIHFNLIQRTYKMQDSIIAYVVVVAFKFFWLAENSPLNSPECKQGPQGSGVWNDEADIFE